MGLEAAELAHERITQMRTSFNAIIKLTAVITLLLVSFVVVQAANKVSISQAMALPTKDNPNHWQIFVGFSAGFDIPDSLDDVEDPSKTSIKKTGNFYLFDVDSAQRVSIVFVYFDAAPFYTSRKFNGSGHPDAVTLYIDPGFRLDPKHHYHLYVLNVPFNGKPTDDPQPARFIEFAPAVAAGTAQPETGDPATGDSLSFTAAKDREDSNIYLSGQYSGASGTKFRGAVDLKIELPFHKVIRNRTHSFSPFFELKASTDPKADPDSMNFGLNWEWPIWRHRGDNLKAPIRRITWRNAPKIESDRSFDNTNFIWESRFRFISRSYVGKHVTFYFRPFLGQELGVNINSPIKDAEGKLLYRPIAGTSLTLIFPVNAPGLHDLSLEGSYIRRWPLRREISFEEDEDGNLKTLSIGKAPRDHVTSKFNINFSESFGASISYEYGQLPPAFKLVDHKTTIGLTYKIKLDR